MNLISQDYLIHYGVKGMKWGVRHDNRPYGQRFVKSDGSLTIRGQRKQKHIDQKIDRVKKRVADADRRLADQKKMSKFVNDPKNKQKVTDMAMKDFWGEDYKNKDYLEKLEEKPYKKLQSEAYNHYKKIYSPSVSSNLNKYKKASQSWLSQYGSTKISDIKTKEEYKKFIGPMDYKIGKDTWRIY